MAESADTSVARILIGQQRRTDDADQTSRRQMNADLAVVLVLLAAAIVMFAINKPRMDATALIMLTVLPFTGVITVDEALAGFSDSTIVLLAALFVIGAGLVRTGVAQWLGDWLTKKAGASENRLIVLLMGVVAPLGAFMSSTGVVAIFIPVGLRIAQSTGTAPSQLMMPLSVAALISGMTTLIATAPNLVVNGELLRHGMAGLHFFSFTPFGLPVLILGIAYMLFARRWLPASTRRMARPAGRASRLDRAVKLAEPRVPAPRDGTVTTGRARRSGSSTCAAPRAPTSSRSSAAAMILARRHPARRRRPNCRRPTFCSSTCSR